MSPYNASPGDRSAMLQAASNSIGECPVLPIRRIGSNRPDAANAVERAIDQAAAPDKSSDASPTLVGLAIRYPEKTFFLGQVFKDTTNSYKLVWFLAILALIKRSDEKAFPIAALLTEMAVAAWHPVCLYRLSLGRQDQLQHVILELQEQSGLSLQAKPQAIRKFVARSGAARQLEYFRPTK